MAENRERQAPRRGTSALIPGVTLYAEEGRDGYVRWRVRASAMIGGRQRLKSFSPTRHGLTRALSAACAYRLEHHPDAGDSIGDLVRAAREAIPPETIQAMREAGVQVG